MANKSELIGTMVSLRNVNMVEVEGEVKSELKQAINNSEDNTMQKMKK